MLRSVSPIHLEYLANMGVAASMSLSLIVNGELWGMVACHHRSPRFPGYRRRVALELFAQMASFQLETKLEAEALGSRLRQKTISENLVASLSRNVELAAGLRQFQPRLLDYIGAAGVGLWIDGRFSGCGTVPRADEMARLVRWLNENMTEGVFHTDCLSGLYSRAAGFADTASGILALSVSRTPRDYVIWFKPEVIQTVTWAGDPRKPAEGERISPRKSFAAWKQTVQFKSEPWTPLDLRTAQSLRLSLLEIVLEHTDQLARERERARIQQLALLAQLDDRIAQWEKTAGELKRESDRRAVVEAELSQVLRRTVLEQEAERQRIARELHDSLGQYLTVMQLDLDGIGRDTQASASIRRRVEKLKSLTTDVGQEVNQMAWEIRPTALDDLGLQKAFQQFLEEWAERSPLQFDVHLALNDRRLPPAIETALYRVLQEAIRNVVKHAQASRVGVILEATAREVRLIVEDDGRGFVWETSARAVAASDRLGLLGIRERLALVGGILEVETSPGSGTTLLIHVPL
jgi:light-regulated signal transduction histidine kinase (bacteriophytochrome)